MRNFIIVLLAESYLQLGNKRGAAYVGLLGQKEMGIGLWWESLNERGRLKHIDVDIR
jgi:hypothetical protein